jgi:hypothetical protein
MKPMHIIFNPKYSRKSLYGAGIFPFWLYIAFFGKPVYKFSRKLGLNQFFSLMMANILGSLCHVTFFANGLIEIPAFIISLFTMASAFWFINKEKHFYAFTILIVGVLAWTNVTSYVVKILA